MEARRWRAAVRGSVPQTLTAVRVVLGALALGAAADGRLFTSATLITLGAVTDGLDGPLARRLGVATPFGALFDYFADYVCYVVAPWGLTRALVPAAPDIALALPLFTGAVRYARNGVVVSAAPSDVRELPGLGTVFFAFVPVTAVFLDAGASLGVERMSAVVLALATTLSVLMLVPVRYPKLAAWRGLSPAVLALLSLMPFWGTRAIAAATVCLGISYVVAAPCAAAMARRQGKSGTPR
jgi:CDP-diacylglycerol--serine O-phosphatidyltransferase